MPRYCLQLFKPLDVVSASFPSRSRPCARNSVRRRHKHGLGCSGLAIAVVRRNGVYNLRAFPVLFSLAYIVQQASALCKIYVQTKLRRHKTRKLRNLD